MGKPCPAGVGICQGLMSVVKWMLSKLARVWQARELPGRACWVWRMVFMPLLFTCIESLSKYGRKRVPDDQHRRPRF